MYVSFFDHGSRHHEINPIDASLSTVSQSRPIFFEYDKFTELVIKYACSVVSTGIL